MSSPSGESRASSAFAALGENLAAVDSHDSLSGFASATSPKAKSSLSNNSAATDIKTDLKAIRQFSKHQNVTLRDVVESLARSIIKVARDNDKLPPLTLTLTAFDAVKPPDVDLVWYLWRIVNDLNAMKDPLLFRPDGSSNLDMTTNDYDTEDHTAMGRGLRCLLLSLIYVDRMTTKSAAWFRISSRNVHRVMLGTMYAALKYSDDSPGRLSYFAQLGGIPADQLKTIELAVCKALQFDFYVTETEFRGTSLSHLNLAVRGAAIRKSRNRAFVKTVVAQHINVLHHGDTTNPLNSVAQRDPSSLPVLVNDQ